MGSFTSAFSVTSILVLFSAFLTSDYLVIRMVSDPSRAPAIAGDAVLIRALTVLPVGAAIYLYVRLSGVAPADAPIYYLVGAMALAALMVESIQASFKSIERMEYIGISNLASAVASDAIAVAIIVVGGGAVALSGATAVVTVVVLGINVIWVLRIRQLTFNPSVSGLSSLAAQGLPYWPKQFAMVVYVYVDTVLLSAMQRPEVVGWYGLGSRILGTLLFIPTILCTAWYPRLIAASQVSRETLRDEVRPFLRLACTTSIPIAFATAAAAEPVIRTVYGAGYSKSVSVTIVLGFCAIPMYLGISLGYLLAAMRRPMAVTSVLLIGIGVNVPLNLVLVPLFAHQFSNGALGAAVSLLVTEIVITIGLLICTGRHLMDPATLSRIPAVLLASAAMFGVARLASPLGLGALAVAGLAFCIVAVPLKVLSSNERAAFFRYARQVAGGGRRARRASTAAE
jgi:O-antigen/teichoic acid export membrane protein